MSVASASRRITSVLSQISPSTLFCSSNSSTSAISAGLCSAAEWSCADLVDKYGSDVFLLDPQLKSFGKRKKFHGTIHTVKVFEDNSLIRTILERPNAGAGKVLVIDGGNSTRYALLGDQLAALAVKNGWQGIIIHGCVRDSAVINELELGVRALGTTPVKSNKRGWGAENLDVQFGHGLIIKNGNYVFADEDGVLISAKKLL